MSDTNPYLRRDGIKLSSRWIDDAEVFGRISELAADDDGQVRFQVAVTLGETDRSAATDLLTGLALRDGHDPWFAQAHSLLIQESLR